MNIRKLKSPWKILEIDPWLGPYSKEIELRMKRFREQRKKIAGNENTVSSFANGHMYYGFHRTGTGWAFREWLPGADEVWLTGDFNGWDRTSHPLTRLENGVWEILLEGKDALKHGQHVKLWVRNGENCFERLPAYSTRTRMDWDAHKLCTQVWDPEPFAWTDAGWRETEYGEPLIYEAHVGMAQEYEGIGTYREFADTILDKARDLGYNTVQLMAIQEHPYYGSFG